MTRELNLARKHVKSWYSASSTLSSPIWQAICTGLGFNNSQHTRTLQKSQVTMHQWRVLLRGMMSMQPHAVVPCSSWHVNGHGQATDEFWVMCWDHEAIFVCWQSGRVYVQRNASRGMNWKWLRDLPDDVVLRLAGALWS